MFSFTFKSFDQNFKSNTIPVERLIISPLFINNYSDEQRENTETPFKENCSFNSNIPYTFFKEVKTTFAIDMSINLHQTKSSLFSSEHIKDNAQTHTQGAHSHAQAPIEYQSPLSHLIFINQLKINDKYLTYFPIIIEPNDELLLNIIHPFGESLNMSIMPIHKSIKVIIDLSLSKRSDEFILQYKALKKSMEEDDNMLITLTNPKDIIKYFFDKIKYFIHSIQLNYILQKRKTINENLLVNCQKVIERCNEMAELFYNDFFTSKQISINEVSIPKPVMPIEDDFSDNSSAFDESVIHCKLCKRQFKSGCALGGHMSRVHPHKSEQYKKKQRIRKRRNEYRAAIYEAKKDLCTYHDYDYEDMISSQKGKKALRRLILFNKKEYNRILRQIKLNKGLIVI